MSPRRRTLLGFAVVAVLLFVFPSFQEALDLPRFVVIFLFTVFFWVAQASSWNILTGYSGYFSFGHGAFYGIGVYTAAILSVKHGWAFLATIPVAGILSGLFGLGLGLVTFRLRSLSGEIFALTTLAVAFVLAALARLLPSIDGGVGIFVTGTPIPEILGDFTTAMYRMTLIVALGTVLVSYLIHSSRFGWGLFAIRDDEPVAQSLGVPAFGYKMAALGVAASLSGLMGAIWAQQIGFVTVADVFNIRVPLFVIIMSILGGTTHWAGPVIGAVIITTLADRLNSAGLEDVNQIIIGALLVVLVLAVRGGLFGRLRERRIVAGSVFVVSMALLILIPEEMSIISAFGWSLLATSTLLLVPPKLWPRRSIEAAA